MLCMGKYIMFFIGYKLLFLVDVIGVEWKNIGFRFDYDLFVNNWMVC